MSWIRDLRYVRLGASDLDRSVRFATEILGLELVQRDASRAYLRAGHGQHHHICYVKSDLGQVFAHEALGFEAPTALELDGVVASLDRAGLRVRESSQGEKDERRVCALYTLADPTGNKLELFHTLAPDGHCTFGRDAGISSFSHVGLRTTDAKRDERFWTGELGARVSDWIGDAALLRIDDVHHKIALFPSKRPGVQHVNFQVNSVDDVMRSYYWLKERGVRIVFGPGRHPTSSAVFLYFEGPDDIVYEYSNGVRLIADETGYQPRRFPFEPQSFCMWGSRPDIPEFRTAGGATAAAANAGASAEPLLQAGLL